MHMEQLHNTLALCSLFLLLTINQTAPSPAPDSSLLCISECGTCPLICSPPPSPSSAASKPPPSVETKPPPSPKPKPGSSEPPPYLTPIYHPIPPQSYYPPPSSTPPSRPQAGKSCPPPSYIAMGSNAPPPPPPPPKLVVVPSTQMPPTDGIGPNRPYYYFYASKGVTSSLDVSGFLILFICFHLMFLFLG